MMEVKFAFFGQNSQSEKVSMNNQYKLQFFCKARRVNNHYKITYSERLNDGLI